MDEQARKISHLDRLALFIRKVSSPPIMVTLLLCILFVVQPGIFPSPLSFALSLLFLAGIPLAAYPVSFLFPTLRKRGREAQRKLAFLFNLVGYVGAVCYGFIVRVAQPLRLVYFTYAISVVVLIIFNKILKIRASGHASSLTGPLILLVYFVGWIVVPPCLCIGALVAWASLRLKRHTPYDLLWGALVALASFGLSLLLSGII